MTDRSCALVIGAGVAGCSTAFALARHGWSVRMLAAPSGGDASDVPAAILAPPPLPGNDHVTAFRYRAAAIAGAWYRHLGTRHPAIRLGRGVLLLPKRERDHRRFSQLPHSGAGPVRVSANRAAAMSGASLRQPCVYHPGGGWFDPAALRAALRDHEAIEGPMPVTCSGLRRRGSHWIAIGQGGEEIAAAPTCIVAAGMGSAWLVPAFEPLLTPARGQVTAVRCSRLRMAVSGNGHAVPGADGRIWLGATIERGDDDGAPRDADDRSNLALHGRLWPDEPIPQACASFAAVRTTTRDRLPLAGMFEEGLWINTGHGTQGLLTTPVTALLIARAISRRCVHPLLRRLSPDRRAARSGTSRR